MKTNNKFISILFLLFILSSNLFSDVVSEYFSDTVFDYAKYSFNKKDYESSLKYFKESAKDGDSRAFYFLGIHYNLGYAVPENIDTAIFYYKKGADNSDANCMNALGTAYEKKKDYKKAVYWYKKAVSTDKYQADALLSLGLTYYKGGHGVTQNMVKTAQYFKQCAMLDEKMVILPSTVQSCQKNLGIVCRQTPWACQK